MTIQDLCFADTCGGTINSAERTTISSPAYPSSYSNNGRCDWDVDVGQGRAVLELTAFSTESCCDYLYVSGDEYGCIEKTCVT